MNTSLEKWDAVGDAVTALALKLKLHVEQATSAPNEEIQTAAAAACDGVEAAFDGLQAAIDDPAVKQNVKDVATALRDAVSDALAHVSAGVDDIADKVAP